MSRKASEQLDRQPDRQEQETTASAAQRYPNQGKDGSAYFEYREIFSHPRPSPDPQDQSSGGNDTESRWCASATIQICAQCSRSHWHSALAVTEHGADARRYPPISYEPNIWRFSHHSREDGSGSEQICQQCGGAAPAINTGRKPARSNVASCRFAPAGTVDSEQWCLEQ